MIEPPGKIAIGSVVTDDCLLEFVILYESILESWTGCPFGLHAFAGDDRVAKRLADAGLEHVEIHRFHGAAGNVDLVEHSGLERCIVTDADNVFLAEIPELSFVLGEHDLAFIGGSGPDRPIQTSLWSFRRTERSIEFARRWRARLADVDASDAGRMLAELLTGGQVDAVEMPSAYALDADRESLSLHHDQLGVLEENMGRIKVLHLAGVPARGDESLTDQIDAVIDRFPQIAPLMTFYATLAARAAARLGIDVVVAPEVYARDRLMDAGVLARRNQLPELLNRRGLGGTGAEVGVKRGVFSEVILRSWRGRTLISIDPWLEARAGEYVDASNVAQAQHDRFYEETIRRLEKFGDRSAIWRTTSTEAAARIEPRALDFVYLDARHDYDSVKQDLEHWFDKIRAGGIFAGHDYLDEVRGSGEYGVKSAVDEFFAARGLPVRSTYVDARFREGPPPSWLVEIP